VVELAPERGRDAREVLRVAHERAAGGAAAVADRHLDRVEARAPERQGQHLRVVVVVADSGGGERLATERPIAALAVRDDRLHQRAEQSARQAVRERAVPRHAVAVAEEAGADHVLRAPARDRLEHALEVGGVVLAVPVEVDRGVVPAVASGGETLPDGGTQAVRVRVRHDLRARVTSDRRRVVARAVVDHEHVHAHAAGGPRDPDDHVADRGRLVLSRDDREATGGTWLPAAGRQERPTARRSRRLHAEQRADRHRQLTDVVGLVVDGAGDRARAVHDERNRRLAPVEVPVAADAAALAVVRHQNHGRVLELAALAEPGEEARHVAVGLFELVDVLAVANPADVAELVRREQLEHQQVGVVALDHLARRGDERVVDPLRRLHRRDGAHHALAERVEQVRDADQPAALAVSLEHVEHRLAPHAEPGREVGVHPVVLRGGPREHRREADDRPRRVGGLDRQVLGALAREAVDRRRVGLPQPLAVAAVDDDHIDAPGERLRRRSLRARRVRRQPAREPPPRERAERR